VGFENILDGYFYDNNRDVYFDYLESRSSLLFFYFEDLRFYLGAGPTFGFFTSPYSQDDVYNEYGAKVAAEYSWGRLWLSGSYEAGRRDYNVDSDESIYSDFLYHRILTFATVRITTNTSLSLFVNHEPEDHRVEDDDSTTTLFSLDLSYSF
jgi:hypothetical protein